MFWPPPLQTRHVRCYSARGMPAPARRTEQSASPGARRHVDSSSSRRQMARTGAARYQVDATPDIASVAAATRRRRATSPLAAFAAE